MVNKQNVENRIPQKEIRNYKEFNNDFSPIPKKKSNRDLDLGNTFNQQMQFSEARPAASITFSPSPAQNQRYDY